MEDSSYSHGILFIVVRAGLGYDVGLDVVLIQCCRICSFISMLTGLSRLTISRTQSHIVETAMSTLYRRKMPNCRDGG